MKKKKNSEKKGKVFVIGTGPGCTDYMSAKALEALNIAEVIIGYSKYISIIEEETDLSNKKIIRSNMTEETERCRLAAEYARKGFITALVSSGDPGIYGMASPFTEINSATEEPAEFEIIPGITAYSAASAILGSPACHDHCIISLSDRLTPVDLIFRRVRAAAKADFIIIFYNPRSKGRPAYLKRAFEIIGEYRSGTTPVGTVKNIARENEKKFLSDLSTYNFEDADMSSLIIIGNSSTYIKKGLMITPRGYRR